jgi:hypothetical protein
MQPTVPGWWHAGPLRKVVSVPNQKILFLKLQVSAFPAVIVGYIPLGLEPQNIKSLWGSGLIREIFGFQLGNSWGSG